MTNSTSTTESSSNIEKLFNANAIKSFDYCLDYVNELSLYEHALVKIEGDIDLQADLPAINKVTKEQAKASVKKLIDSAIRSIESSWSLDTKYAKLFRTTVRFNNPNDSALPCFDIEHKAKNEHGDVKIQIKTWRRNLEVKVIGKEKAIEMLHGQLVMSGFKS
jgi:hypothetical protein